MAFFCVQYKNLALQKFPKSKVSYNQRNITNPLKYFRLTKYNGLIGRITKINLTTNMNNNSNQKQHENLGLFNSNNKINRPKLKSSDSNSLRTNSIPLSSLRTKKNLMPQQSVPLETMLEPPYLSRQDSVSSSIYNNNRGSNLDLNEDCISNGATSAFSSLKIPSKYKTNYRKSFDKNSIAHSVSQSTIHLKNNDDYYDSSNKNDFTKQG